MKILQTVSAWLAKWTPLVVSLAAVLSYFERGLFEWVRCSPGFSTRWIR